jgi:hypothetical protein
MQPCADRASRCRLCRVAGRRRRNAHGGASLTGRHGTGRDALRRVRRILQPSNTNASPVNQTHHAGDHRRRHRKPATSRDTCWVASIPREGCATPAAPVSSTGGRQRNSVQHSRQLHKPATGASRIPGRSPCQRRGPASSTCPKPCRTTRSSPPLSPRSPLTPRSSISDGDTPSGTNASVQSCPSRTYLYYATSLLLTMRTDV